MNVERAHKNVPDDNSGKARALRGRILIRLSQQRTPEKLKSPERAGCHSDISINFTSASGNGTNNSHKKCFLQNNSHEYG